MSLSYLCYCCCLQKVVLKMLQFSLIIFVYVAVLLRGTANIWTNIAPSSLKLRLVD